MTFVFIHGLGQTCQAWERTLVQLNQYDSVQTPDFLELLNGKPVTYTNLYESCVLAWSQNQKKIHLCGLSLGAILALNYALDYPERIASLVLIAPQFKMPRALMSVQNTIFRLLPQRAFKTMGFNKHDVLTLTQSMAPLDFSNRLTPFNFPSCVMCGSKDKANKKSSYMLSSFTRHGYVEVDDSGHAVNEDNPKLLAEKLTSFYNSFLSEEYLE
ncbi:alpha/beta hydrolase [Erysipelothrix sp. HDW6C]|uniref:alpha/beta fold hydrolase n=1 Tax=Erysipelothrix sp. HDW6C TaxID=2714930 RepID=UPI00140890EE|nr:alpha/beta hydrolase [Erysipelothrix sp. HDW6C]QIK70141.1 alpha/beta hydrolase [Erysipelothrix sp. HDW6C]